MEIITRVLVLIYVNACWFEIKSTLLHFITFRFRARDYSLYLMCSMYVDHKHNQPEFHGSSQSFK